MKAVLDSNVVVSGLIFTGNEHLVLEHGRRGRFELVLSLFVLAEVGDVLTRKFGWSDSRVARAVASLGDAATLVEPRETPTIVPGDHPDNRILACAAEARADYLVTGDGRHLLPIGEYGGARIVRAPVFLAALDEADLA